MKKLKVCMLHNRVKNASDIYKYLHFKEEDVSYKLIWDEEEPDYLIATELIYTDYYLWNKFVRMYSKASVCIYHAGECIAPDMNVFDYAIVFDKNLRCEDRIVRQPTRLFFGNYIFEKGNSLVGCERCLLEREWSNRKFCNYIYSNGGAHENRTKIFHILSGYKKVDSWGGYLNNIGQRWESAKKLETRLLIKECITIKSNYKFSIAFENAIYKGYTSEKIFSSLEAHSIPIYWGNPLIVEELNPEAFINCHNFDSLEDVLEEVKKIDNDQDLWIKMVSSPWLTREQLENEQKEIDEYYNFLDNVFTQPIEAARRRGEGFHPERYRNWFFRMQSNNNRFQSYHDVEIKWIENLQNGISIEKYFVKNNYKTVAIYGMAQLGLRLYYELMQTSDVAVVYGIDQGNPIVPEEVKIYKIFELVDKEVPDIIVITVPHLYNVIEADLRGVYTGEIVSIKEIIECMED